MQIVHRSCNDCAFFFILFSNSAPLFRIKVICLVFSLLHFSTTKIPFHSVFLIDFKVDTRLLYTVAYGWYANYAGVFVLVVAVFVCLYSFDEQFQSNKQGIPKKIQSQNHHHFVAIFIDFFFQWNFFSTNKSLLISRWIEYKVKTTLRLLQVRSICTVSTHYEWEKMWKVQFIIRELRIGNRKCFKIRTTMWKCHLYQFSSVLMHFECVPFRIFDWNIEFEFKFKRNIHTNLNRTSLFKLRISLKMPTFFWINRCQWKHLALTFYQTIKNVWVFLVRFCILFHGLCFVFLFFILQ